MTIRNRLVIVMMVGLASRARADEPDEDDGEIKVAEANVLFREGKRLMDEGETSKACVKFETSYRLAAREGVHLNLAQCWDKLGKTASAWAIYTQIAKTTKLDNRRTESKNRVRELEAELVRLTIEVPESAQLDGLEITRNDVVVESAQWGSAVPVDPDDYTITAKAEGRETWTKRVKVRKTDKVVEIPKLVKAKLDPKKLPDERNPNRKLAIGLVVGGGGAIAIGTVFAVRSRTLQQQAEQLCPRQKCGDQRGVDRGHRARTEGWIATIGLGLGAAAIVTGAVVWKRGKRQDRAVSIAPVIGKQTGLVLGGSF